MVLDYDQRQAVFAEEENVLVVSGAGSGKTRVLTSRIERLIKSGVHPMNIVAITFTNLAAEEMRQRLSHLNTLGIFIGTIHGFANHILRENGKEVPVNSLKESETYFLEMVSKAIPLCAGREKVHLLIDEFQDVGDFEFDFIQAIPAKSRFYVGDDWQAIYTFKGGNVKHFHGLIKGKVFKKYYLANNYRNSQQVLIKSLEEINKLETKTEKRIRYMGKNNGSVTYYKTLEEGVIELIRKGNLGKSAVLCRTQEEIDAVRWILERERVKTCTFRIKDTNYDKLQTMLSDERLKLLTIHGSKGLEFENVLVLGTRNWNDEEALVNYVAFTRAKNHLLIV